MRRYYWQDEKTGRPPLIVIAGPTAVGKTEAAIRLSEEIGGEIISADSMQVYRGMDIGTAKVRPSEMRGIVHHLINILDPWESYDVTRFKELAKEAAQGIASRGHIPVVCGGTGFYIQALLYDIDFTEEQDQERSLAIRRRYTEEAERFGRDQVHERLRDIDPLSYERIPANNLKRVIRALEFYELHGEPISLHNDRELEKRSHSPYDFRFFALTDERSALYGRIDRRVDEMMRAGLLSEVKKLLSLGVPDTATSMQAIGYRELRSYLRGEIGLEIAVELIKKNSRHYAKRQLTWLRRDPNVIEIDISRIGDVQDGIRKYICSHGDIEGGL